ncbi:MAG TPA: hypothetical protein PK129_07190, partial [Cellvibrionaceae bacterium]|nr:hypothetical protein [Cellvibrionaceae bacterium]
KIDQDDLFCRRVNKLTVKVFVALNWIAIFDATVKPPFDTLRVDGLGLVLENTTHGPPTALVLSRRI